MDKRAKELLERAIDLNPNLSSAHYKLGILFQSENDFDSSLTYFEQAVTINPSFPEAECELAIELGRKGKLEDGDLKAIEELAADIAKQY